MKTSILFFLKAFTFVSLMLYGCTNTIDLNNGNLPQSDGSTLKTHVYGVLPMTAEQYLDIPLYSKETFEAGLTLKSATARVPVYTLATPAVRDQGQIGSCTAFCGVEIDEILYYYKNNKSWTKVLSPAFIYYCERVLIEKSDITVDVGAPMVDIPKALQKYGDCFESSYPYPGSNTSIAYTTAPTKSAMTEGLKYRIGQSKFSYAMIPSDDIEAVKNILRNDVPVMMGFNVYDDPNATPVTYPYFERLNTIKYTYNPLTNRGELVAGAVLLGGHAVPIVGYDDNRKAFLCQNSWSSSWGNKGFFFMPYSVFTSKIIVTRGSVYYATL